MGRPLYEPLDGRSVPQPILQPGMMARCTDNGSTKEGLVESVYFKSSWRRPARYEYHISCCSSPLHDHSIIDSRWPEQGPRPEFVNGQEYYIDVELRGNGIRAIVQVQTSLNGRADVILYGADRNELYAVRKTTLEKMVKKQEALTSNNSSADLHKLAV